MSPAVECNDLVFLTGFNGMPLKGDLSPDLPEQIREAFMGFRGPNLLRGRYRRTT
jgi:enamine deaminase RidA (YjgF/YER057c/UK114 family)